MTFKTVEEAIAHVNMCIEKSWKEVSGLQAQVLKPALPGLSSNKVRHFLNNLCGFEGCRYLEIGSYTGSTLIAAGFNNAQKGMIGAAAIDDWSMDRGAQAKFTHNLVAFRNYLPPIKQISHEAFSLPDKNTLGAFNVYFYDGCHGAGPQEQAWLKYWNNLDNISIVVIDDYAVFRVQQGTIRALDKLDFKKHLKGAWSLPGGEKIFRDDLYWGGLGVFVVQK